MTQVFVNLLDNAIKHTPLGTPIHISGSESNGLVHVVVDDGGPGLPSVDPEQLFAKFQRGREQSNVGGAGLGLTICRAIVEAHGGHISAATRPSGGARFAFTLPATGARP